MPNLTFPSPTLFVGREAELNQLHRILHSAIADQKPKFILIQGDFGVGKTALVERFLADVSVQELSVLIGRSKCAMETEFNGMVPFSQLLVTLTEQGIQRRIVLTQLLEFIKEVAPAWLDIVSLGAASATVKTIEEGSKLLGRSTFSQENVFVQFTNALNKLAEKRPIIAFIDDLHWADTSSLSLLFHLARNIENGAVFFVCTFRPVAAMENSRNAALFRDIRANLIRHGAIELELRQGIDVDKYLAQRYPLNTFLPTVVRHVQELTGGHALFVSELFSLWQETGVITSTPTHDGRLVWALSREAEVSYVIPQTISEVLAERLRLMEDDLREILTCASVEGEDFTAQVIICLRRLEEDKVYESLERLEQRYRFIQEQGIKEVDSTVLDFYRFIHRFFREYIYDQLGAGRRRILHKQVGECLEKLYSDRREIAGQLALHFREAHELFKSARYAMMTAQFEHSRYAWLEGEQWCEFGLTLIGRLPSSFESKQVQLDLLEQLGYGYSYASKYSQANQRYQEALDLAQQLQVDTERIIKIYIRLADICEYEGRPEKAVALYEEARQVLKESALPFGEIHIELNADYTFMQDRQGNTDLAIRTYRKLLLDVEKLPQTPSLQNILADIYNYLGIALGKLGQYTEASISYRKAIELASRIANRKLEAACWLNIADDCLKKGEFEQSAICASRGLEIAHHIGDPDDVAYAQATKGAALLAQKKLREAEYELIEAIALAEKSDSLWNMPYMYADLAIVYLMLSDVEVAYQKAIRAVTYAQNNLYQLEFSYALDALAQVEVAQGDWKSAEQHFQQAIIIHQQGGYRHFEARTKRHFAKALLHRGEWERAAELLQTALVIFQELGLAHEITETQQLLDASTTGGK